jgi:hypothetical protein
MMRRRASGSTALLAALAITACSGKADGGPGTTVTVQPASAALCVGDSVVFSARALDGAGQDLPAAQFVWSSSAPGIASIDPASGVAHGLAFGSTQITAAAAGARSAPAALDVPGDLVPEFMPDSAVLAAGDTITLGVRLRRLSNGPLPNHVPVIAPFSSRVASLDITGLVTAKDTGRASLPLTVCGQAGGGAVDVFAPPDSVTGRGYLWLSGPADLRVRFPTRALNFTRKNGRPAFQVVGPVSGPLAFVYEDTVALTQSGQFPLDSLNSTEVVAQLACTPPRPFALYSNNGAATTLLLGMAGGSVRITSFVPQTSYAAVSGRMLFRMRGVVGGAAQLDTLSAIFTFSSPLVTMVGACP